MGNMQLLGCQAVTYDKSLGIVSKCLKDLTLGTTDFWASKSKFFCCCWKPLAMWTCINKSHYAVPLQKDVRLSSILHVRGFSINTLFPPLQNRSEWFRYWTEPQRLPGSTITHQSQTVKHYKRRVLHLFPISLGLGQSKTWGEDALPCQLSRAHLVHYKAGFYYTYNKLHKPLARQKKKKKGFSLFRRN